MEAFKNAPISEGVPHGPHRPLTYFQIAEREEHEYGRNLTEAEIIALQAMHQVSETAWSYTEVGKIREAEPLHNEATIMDIRIHNGRHLQ